MKKQKIVAGCLLLLAVFGITLLTGQLYLSQEDREYRVIYIPKVLDETSDFWVQMAEGVKMAAEEANVQLTVAGAEEESDYRTQNLLMEQALEQNPDAVILVPSGYQENAKMARKIKDAGIVLVIADSAIEGDFGDCFVATDNVEAGRKQGEWLKTLLREDSQIAVVAHEKNASTALEREEGLRKGLAEEQDKIVTVEYSGSSYENAAAVTKKILEEYPDVDFIVGLNEYTTVGAARTVKELGRCDDISMIGFDSSIEEIQLLEEGLLTAMVIQKPFVMGYTAMEAALDCLRERRPQSEMDSGSVLITVENLYQQENQKLLFPFQE